VLLCQPEKPLFGKVSLDFDSVFHGPPVEAIDLTCLDQGPSHYQHFPGDRIMADLCALAPTIKG